MSRLAPGRRDDMQRLLDRRDSYDQYSAKWNLNQLKIDDLLEEGKCNVIHHLRGRLLSAAIANDDIEIINISHEIDEHMKHNHRKRFERAWLKKG